MTGDTAAAPSCSVVIPVYNSEGSVERVVDRVVDVLGGVTADFEVILVEDGSRDGSWAAVRRITAKHANARGIRLKRNYGQHNALLCGIRAVTKDVTVTIDDDLQHPPEEIPRLLEALGDGFDVVYGRPRRQKHGLWRDLASTVTKIALRSAMGAGTARHVSAFRAFRTHLRDAFAEYRSPFLSIDVLLTWGTRRFGDVEVTHEDRPVGESNYTFGKLLTHALNMMTGFSTLPLRLASLVGFFFTLFGIGVLVYVLVRYLTIGGVVPGFAFLASVIAIFSGAQLFALGIVGEYLARMHFRMMERPTYAVLADTEAGTPAGADEAGE
jgi:undecaprenyl-phosphate 4-deoxy-4-formamido-L-arabinose transferase